MFCITFNVKLYIQIKNEKIALNINLVFFSSNLQCRFVEIVETYLLGDEISIEFLQNLYFLWDMCLEERSAKMWVV